MLSIKYKTIIVFICALLLYFILVISNEAPINENMGYSIFLYLLGVCFFTPVLTGAPITVPYSGTVLVKGKDKVIRGFFASIYIFIAVIGLLFAF